MSSIKSITIEIGGSRDLSEIKSGFVRDMETIFKDHIVPEKIEHDDGICTIKVQISGEEIKNKIQAKIETAVAAIEKMAIPNKR